MFVELNCLEIKEHLFCSDFFREHHHSCGSPLASLCFELMLGFDTVWASKNAKTSIYYDCLHSIFIPVFIFIFFSDCLPFHKSKHGSCEIEKKDGRKFKMEFVFILCLIS